MSTTDRYLYEIPEIRSGLEYLLSNDPVFKNINVTINELKWPYNGPGFPGLVKIVCGQQVSTSAAKAIWSRLESEFPVITPEEIIACENGRITSQGLSRPKTLYIKGLAEAIISGSIDLDRMKEKTNDQIKEEITSIKGFGPWSAEMYLMFCLARANIWPAGDLGIQLGLQKYLDINEKPNAEQTAQEAKRFAPHLTSASILLWHLKSME
jgi:DNA-3-methyladenine glycosylase II